MEKDSSLIVKDRNEFTLEDHLFHSADTTEYLLLELHESVSYNDVEMTQNLVNKNYDVNVRDSTGTTPLMISVRNKNEIIIKILLDAGADITVSNHENISALQMFCADHYFTSTIQKLFFHELRKSFTTSYETAQCLINFGCQLYQAAYLGDAKVIEYMLEQGLPTYSVHPISNQTELHIAVSLGNVDGVELLLKYVINEACDINDENIITKNLINITYYVNAQDSNGDTPLMIAVKDRNEIMIKNLLDAGADITVLNYKNRSALQMFCADHYFTSSIQQLFFHELRTIIATSEETAQCLINFGCQLYQVVYLRDAKMIEYMLELGLPACSVHPISNQTELHIAVSLGNVDGVKLLLKYVSNEASNINDGNKLMTKNLIDINHYVNAQDSNGDTPLMIAVRIKNEIMIRVLLDAGADITVSNHENISALQMFCANHYFTFTIQKRFFHELRKIFTTSEEIAQCLIDADCQLYQAAYFGDAKIIELLLRQGFSPNSMHLTNKTTALHIAVSLENIDSVKWLIKYGANLNAQDVQGSTPLFYLCKSCTVHTWEKVEILKVFLHLESLPTSSNLSGSFQIGPVLTRGSREMIRIILQSNIDFGAKDQPTEMNVLHYLAVNTNPGVIDELKLHLDKLNLNVVNQSGMSPLHVAVKFDNVDMVKLLLSQGVSSNCAHHQYGYTPLYYAYAKFSTNFNNQWSEQRDECVELLLHHHANPQFIATDEMNNEELTVFDAAEKTNNLDKLKPVISHLAILEGLGVSITETTCIKMNSHQSLKEYFNKCQKLVKQRICGSVTFFKLLTDDERKIVRYSGNKTNAEAGKTQLQNKFEVLSFIVLQQFDKAFYKSDSA